MDSKKLIKVRVRAMTFEAEGINSYELRTENGGDLPPFKAGSHIDLHLPNGLIHSYSLVNSQEERNRYLIAVNKDPGGRGGSRFMHEILRVGDTLTIGAPRNNFQLVEDAEHSIFIAGGIGITPIWCMIQRLESLKRPWHLYYCTRTRRSAAFLDEMRKFSGRVDTQLHINFDQEPGGQLLDIGKLAASCGPQTHLYCCGPLPMLEAFEKATSARPSGTTHVEYFKAKEQPAATGGFEVVLSKSGKTIRVLPGKTILDAVLDAGVSAPYSCMEGTCATCETRVIEGIPDHRDLVLSKQERELNQVMMICCSGSKSAKLVLDL